MDRCEWSVQAPERSTSSVLLSHKWKDRGEAWKFAGSDFTNFGGFATIIGTSDPTEESICICSRYLLLLMIYHCVSLLFLHIRFDKQNFGSPNGSCENQEVDPHLLAITFDVIYRCGSFWFSGWYWAYMAATNFSSLPCASVITLTMWPWSCV